MTIKQDAGQILNNIYNLKLRGELPNDEAILDVAKNIGKTRTENALKYLDEKGLISGVKIRKTISSSEAILEAANIDITSDGVDVFEEDKFKATFNVGLNLGVISFNTTIEPK